jgi:CHAT domain-containing protein/tetratricopeptide (TPR) repeat protein
VITGPELEKPFAILINIIGRSFQMMVIDGIKRLNLHIFLYFIISIPFFSVSSAGDHIWKSSLNKADSLGRAAEFDSAVVIMRNVLQDMENQLGLRDTLVTHAINQLGAYLCASAHYNEAESLFTLARQINTEIQGPECNDVARNTVNLAILYKELGRYEEAIKSFHEALAIFRKNVDPHDAIIGTCLHNLCYTLWESGYLAEAGLACESSYTIWSKAYGTENPNIARNLSMRANIYYDQKRYHEAESLYTESLRIREKTLGPSHPEVATVLNGLSTVYWSTGQYDKSIEYLTRALDIWTESLGASHPRNAIALMNLADSYRHLGRKDESLAMLNKALNIVKAAYGENHPNIASIYSQMADLYFEEGDYNKAESLAEKTIELRQQFYGSQNPTLSSNERKLARILACKGEYSKSLEHYRRFLDFSQSFIRYAFSYSSDEQKLRWIEEYPPIDEVLFSLAVNIKNDDFAKAAMDMVLRGKAVVIDALMKEKELLVSSQNPQIEADVEQHARICSMIANMMLTSVANKLQENYSDSLKKLYDIQNNLEEKLSRACSEFRTELASQKCNIINVSGAMNANDMLVEFIRYRPYDFDKKGKIEERYLPAHYLAFTLNSSGRVDLFNLGKAQLIDSLVDVYRQSIYGATTDINSDRLAISEKSLNTVSSRLYSLLYQPMAERLDGAEKIFVSPDGALNLIPFEVLQEPDGKYLIENKHFSYLSSGRDLLRFGKPSPTNKTALLFADPDFNHRSENDRDSLPEKTIVLLTGWSSQPERGGYCLAAPFGSLPSSRQEASVVEKLLLDKSGYKVQGYYGSEATEEQIKGIDEPPEIIHIATHGYSCDFSTDTAESSYFNPLLWSGLALAGANRLFDADNKERAGEDGILTSYEVSNFNLLGTELATLSACETGIGRTINGEGVYGLRRAFQHAGAKSILMSLWKVPDKETSQLMQGFYRRWLDGTTKAEALREAALVILRESRRALGTGHPLLWGGFVLVGQPE